MKKFIITLLLALVAFVSFTACEKSGLDTTDDAIVQTDFISVDGISIDLTNQSAKVIDSDYDAYKNFGEIYFDCGNLVSEVTEGNLTTSTYDAIFSFYIEYSLYTTNEKTDITELEELEVVGERANYIFRHLNDDYGDYRQTDMNIDGVDNPKAVAIYYNKEEGTCQSITAETEEDADLTADEFTSGWYLVEEISPYKIRVSGEFETKNGRKVKFNFPIVK